MRLRMSILYAVTMLIVVPVVAFAQANEQIIHSFGSGPQDWFPNAGLTVDSAGNLYGTTLQSCSVYELSPSNGNWTETIIYTLCSPLGAGAPTGGSLIFDGSGNLYGASEGGGAYGAGAVFELSPGAEGWTETVLYSFQGSSDGFGPQMPLVFDSVGNIYGTAVTGGTNGLGTAFKLTHTNRGWIESVLYNFCSRQPNCADGENPAGGLTFDSQGNLYGTMSNIVYELTPSKGSWSEKVLLRQNQYQAGFSDGLIFVGGGLYGTATYGGADGYGLAYELTKAGSGEKEVKYSFNDEADGFPISGLLVDNAGDLDGVAELGSLSCGMAYSLAHKNHTWSETILHSFIGGTDGCYPIGSLVQDSSGNLYGVTQQGGMYQSYFYGAGTVFEISR